MEGETRGGVPKTPSITPHHLHNLQPQDTAAEPSGVLEQRGAYAPSNPLNFIDWEAETQSRWGMRNQIL